MKKNLQLVMSYTLFQDSIWISDNEGNNWHDIAQYPAIGKEEVLKWIKNKISEIESCFKI